MKHKVVEPSASLFQSSKKEQYVDCYLKTKDGKTESMFVIRPGQLFFLEDGLLFGMKSPFVYIPFNDIASVQFTTLTTRTFDLNVSLSSSSEHTFGMIDEGNLTAVTAFIKRYIYVHLRVQCSDLNSIPIRKFEKRLQVLLNLSIKLLIEKIDFLICIGSNFSTCNEWNCTNS